MRRFPAETESFPTPQQGPSTAARSQSCGPGLSIAWRGAVARIPSQAVLRTAPRAMGRSVMKNPLAAPVPSAAAKPSGRQQLIVAMELRIAANDAEMPVPCFNTRSLREPRRRRGAPSQREGVRFRMSLDTSGSSRQTLSPGNTLPQRPVR